MNTTYLTRAQTHLGIGAIARQKHCTGPCRAGNLCPLARHHFNAVDGSANRDIANWQCIPGTDGCILTRHQGSTHLQTTGCNNITTLAIGVAQQGNMCAAVRIVFQTLYASGDTIFGASKINNTIVLFMPATTMTYGNTSMMVTTGAAFFLGQQRCIGGPTMELFVHHFNHAATTSRRGLYFYQCHFNSPLSRVPDRLLCVHMLYARGVDDLRGDQSAWICPFG